MKILALELSSAHGSLAWLDEDLDSVQEWPNDRKHSGQFFENLECTVKTFGAPDKIIVGLGPGSYAGVRIAIAAAIGLQASSRAQLLGYPSLCAIDCTEYCVIGDARRQSFFFARVRGNDVIEGPTLCNETELREKLAALEKSTPIFSSEKLPQFERVELRYPSASILARQAQTPKRKFTLPPLEPIYLREPHITMPKKNIA
jgi:tRNA threonylcarbamoyladenosine biosynthesis protein TsaB